MRSPCCEFLISGDPSPCFITQKKSEASYSGSTITPPKMNNNSLAIEISDDEMDTYPIEISENKPVIDLTNEISPFASNIKTMMSETVIDFTHEISTPSLNVTEVKSENIKLENVKSEMDTDQIIEIPSSPTQNTTEIQRELEDEEPLPPLTTDDYSNEPNNAAIIDRCRADLFVSDNEMDLDSSEIQGEHFKKERSTKKRNTSKGEKVSQKRKRHEKSARTNSSKKPATFGQHVVKVDGDKYIMKEMNTPLYLHQLMGVSWMYKREKCTDRSLPRGGICADAMGLGKTIEAIATIQANTAKSRSSNAPKTTLIIVPASVKEQWFSEIERHGNFPRVLTYKSTDKCKAIHYTDQDILLTTWWELSRSCPFPSKERKNLIMGRRADSNAVDSAETGSSPILQWIEDNREQGGPLHKIEWYRHGIKNHWSRQSLAASALKGKYRWALSGTPIMNCLEERVYGTSRRLAFRVDASLVLQIKDLKIVKKKMLELGQSADKDLCANDAARRLEMADDVGDNDDVVCPECKTPYTFHKNLKRWSSAFSIEPFTPRKGKDALKFHPNMETSNWVTKYDRGRIPLSMSAKLAELREQVQGDKSALKCDEAVRKIENTPDIKVMICDLKCGGVGLNLAFASRVINVDLWWNTCIEQQAFCRVYRIPQPLETHFTRLIVEDSVDWRIYELQLKKKAIIDPTMKGKLTTLELAGLFGRAYFDDNDKLIVEPDHRDTDNHTEEDGLEGAELISTDRESVEDFDSDYADR
ncbi:hypothetical protein HYALB_00008548 [Hymenoscyphus albidus]|uniref:Helicase ATP-binding domain-containing protein n=1 Tax=Hymenoscyphus albidus TaxID=595503 RepID=A0A9N9LF01_9HELO|nr:hypothetical protein HYALB_00008548 [Hymenoscyphus albidus]